MHIKKIVNSTDTDLGQFNYSLTGTTPQRVRFQVQGSTILNAFPRGRPPKRLND